MLEPKFQEFSKKFLPSLKPKSIVSVLEMVKEGATVPFIARYRKEKTGNLDEVNIREILKVHETFEELEKRRNHVLSEIEEQGNLTEELKKSILETDNLIELDEIYRPFKRKKKTKATLAREAGLSPLADWLWELGHGGTDSIAIEVKAKQFLNPTAGIVTYELALKGAQDIITERATNDPGLRALVREHLNAHGKVFSKKTKKFKPHSKFSMYADFSDTLKNLQSEKASHRYLALRRGWHEGELTVTLEGDNDYLLGEFNKFVCPKAIPTVEPLLQEAAKLSLTVHVAPSIVNQIHSHLKEVADEHAIRVFSENLRKLLMASPFGNRCVLGVDPGFRTGCKIALVDPQGNYISHTVLYTEGQGAEEKAKALLQDVLKQIKIEALAVGNGTGGREAEIFFRKILKDLNSEVPVVLVSEAGASVYSASDVAREEFPNLDVSVRGAISIARRLQDPLAELVKIDPKSIGVGQYQHDVSQTELKKTLHGVVESSVNQVGVNLNTASAALLSYVAGIGPAIAQNVVHFRKEHGPFSERTDLQKVPQFSSKTFEQAAGFLRIYGGKVFLDATGIHPERYSVVRDMASDVSLTPAQLVGEKTVNLVEKRDKWVGLIGEFTFDDIVDELKKPGRDPRPEFKTVTFREDIHEVKDLKPGMLCPGVVTNVTNFGAFVDVGVRQDGLVHISEISHQFVNDPRKVLSPGDVVKVKVIAVDLDKPQISLTMKLEPMPQAQPAPRPERPRTPRPPRVPREGQQQGQGQRPQGPRPNGEGNGRPAQKFSKNNADRGPRRDDRGPRQGDRRPPPRPSQPKMILNNPFAELAALRDKLKK